ncbi:MAG: hypothetical protein RL662_1888 [Bacteroidota bacterium]|jgi:uncharacterized iron-regulated membrane protein
MSIRHFFKKIHLWLSIPAGLIIVILCATGAILSFETEILEAYYPERYFVAEVKADKIPLDRLISIVNQQLSDNSVANIKLTADPNRTYTATLANGFRISAFVDPYTGEVKGIYNLRESAFFKVMALHRWLMDGTRTWGKYTMGITTLVFVFIIISGMVWWIPTSKKKVKGRLTINTKSGLKRFLHDAHIALGIYACLFLLICSLTGLMWSFEWYKKGVCRLFGVEIPADKKENTREKNRTPLDASVWQTAFDNSIKQVANYTTITVSDGSVMVLPSDALHTRAMDKYAFDKSSGKITKVSLYADEKSVSKIMTWAYALHVGAFGGITVRILTFLACLIGATLPLTGYYLYYRRLKKKNKPR